LEVIFQENNNIFSSTPLGEIQQEIHLCLDDLCLKRQMVKTYLTDNRELDGACSHQKLKIKCSKQDCDGSCEKSSKKKKHFKKLWIKKIQT